MMTMIESRVVISILVLLLLLAAPSPLHRLAISIERERATWGSLWEAQRSARHGRPPSCVAVAMDPAKHCGHGATTGMVLVRIRERAIPQKVSSLKNISRRGSVMALALLVVLIGHVFQTPDSSDGQRGALEYALDVVPVHIEVRHRIQAPELYGCYVVRLRRFLLRAYRHKKYTKQYRILS